MKTRKQFGEFLNTLSLIGVGAEVGVCRGSFSLSILESWDGLALHAIDSWRHQGVLLDASDEPQEIHDQNFNEARRILRKFVLGGRCNILREFSVDASQMFPDNFLDFVYIDARHDYRSVWSDLEAWYPKVKIGGFVAGHDYKNSFVRKNLVEVKRAVDNFFTIHEKTVQSTTEDNLPSWYILK